MRLLREAGFVSIQAGVGEPQRSDLEVDAQGRHGVPQPAPAQVVRGSRGVKLFWNILYGLPGEPPEEYARMADLMRSLVHLEPPRLVPLALDRLARSRAAGGVRADPARASAGLRLHPPRARCRDPAGARLHVRVPPRRGRKPAAYVRPVREVVEAWRASSETAFGSLRYRRHRRGLAVTDRRPGLAATEYRFGSAEAAGLPGVARTARRWPGWTPRSRGRLRSACRRAGGLSR